MQWELVSDGNIDLSLRVDHEFLDWLRPHVSDYEVAQLDPFRNTALDKRLLECWLAALTKAREAVCKEIAVLVGKQRLPADRATRVVVTGQLIERELARQQWVRTLDDLVALLELARSSHGIVRIIAD